MIELIYILSGYLVLIIVASILILSILFVLSNKSERGKTAIGDNNKEFVSQIKSAKSFVRIVSGELNEKVFEDPEILDAFNEAASKNVDIQIIFGPDVNLKDRKISEISEYPNVMFFQTKEREKFHFTLVDGSYLYREAPHKRLAPQREYIKEYNPRFSSIRSLSLFNSIRRNSKIVSLEN